MFNCGIDEFKTFMKEKPLYVMFEPMLNCDAKTDHLFPKDISSLYFPKLNRI